MSLAEQPGVDRTGRRVRRSGVRLLGIAFRGLAPLGEDFPIQLEMDW